MGLTQNVHFQQFNQNKGLDVSKEVEVKEIVEDVKEPEVIEKKSDSNIELVKVMASDIVTNLSPVVTKEQDQDHELVTSNLSSFVTVTNDNLQALKRQIQELCGSRRWSLIYEGDV